MEKGTRQVYGEEVEQRDTWPKVLLQNNRHYGSSRAAMRHKRNGIWQAYTWQDYYVNVKHLALGLLSLGFCRGEKLVIIGDNAPQWYYAQLAAQANGGVAVGLYSDLSSAEIRYFAQSCDASFAVVEDQEQVDKILEIRDELESIKRIVFWDYKGLVQYEDPILIGYREVLQRGERYEQEHPRLFEENVENGSADEICSIVFTSGTTGDAPKPAVHSYRTMRASVDFCLNLDPWSKKDNIVPSMPPAWMTEQCLSIGCHLLSAAILNFYEKPDTQQQDTREIGPEIVFYGARLWENQASDVQARMLESDAIKRAAFRFFMPVGQKMAELRHSKQTPGIALRLLYALGCVVLFRPLKDDLGLSKARVCYNTGAMLSPDAFKFYHALNLPLKNLYGTTEGGMLSGAENDDIGDGTVGRIGDGTGVRITERGEIAYRQPAVFLGYYKAPEKTAEVMKDGWFHTGDAGMVTTDNHLVLFDRLGHFVQLPGGVRIAPQLIESRLRFGPHVRDAWILAGPGRPYTSAVIVIDKISVGRWAGERKVSYRTFAELSQKPEVYELVKGHIDELNSGLPRDVRIRRFVNLHKEFSPEEGELTRTRKLRRHFVEERYATLMAAIYSGADQVPLEVETRNRAGQVVKATTNVTIKSVDGADS